MSQTRQDWERRARELRIETRAFIDGHYRAAVEGDTFDCQSPIDGRSLGQVASCGVADAELAVQVARERFESERFSEFQEQHLPHLDEVAWEFFGTPRAREAIQAKVAALFPSHEHEQFTEHFWQKIQQWREKDASRRAGARA